jgi:hypothetical protein
MQPRAANDDLSSHRISRAEELGWAIAVSLMIL